MRQSEQLGDEASPFHRGEQAVQQRLGVRAAIEPWARQVVRPCLTEQHRSFYAGLPFLVVGARDALGRSWASILAARPGFAHAPDPERLAIDAGVAEGDALAGAFQPGADLGLLGIDLASRRRNRLNGRLAAAGEGSLMLEVGQAFGNCPQHIHQRAWQWVDGAGTPASATRGTQLSDEVVAWIEGADTLFIASGYRGEGDHPAFGMDVSHRGGAPGFVSVRGDGRLVFPDFAGNNHFNTVGNLIQDPRAGLLFVDFTTGSLLQLTGRASVDFDSAEVASYPGAQRLVVFEVQGWVAQRQALPLRWTVPRQPPRELSLVETVREAEGIKSLLFASADGNPLPAFAAGQYLPIALTLPGFPEPLQRTYSLSGSPGGDRYRITVKREAQGVASRHLHDVIAVGDTLTAAPPAGDFVLSPGRRPVVLVSAGVGLTPMVSMLHALVEGRDPRLLWFVHGARDGAQHALAAEVRALLARSDNRRQLVCFSRPRPVDVRGRDYDVAGRVDGQRLAGILPTLDADFYLCGPSPFMAALKEQLQALGVAGARMHTESFGSTRA